jgi:hypothetical protein
MVYMAIKIERRIKRKGIRHQWGNSGSLFASRLNYRRKEVAISKPNIIGNKATSSKTWSKDSTIKQMVKPRSHLIIIVIWSVPGVWKVYI